MKRAMRRGFTLVELLVVIAIIGILVAMLLPAIQASRESARRLMCTNQISQLVLGVHDYEVAHEHYPSGTVNPTGPIRNLPSGHHISWIARILPYLEESAIYNSTDLALSAYHEKNDPARQTIISMLICPSNPMDEWPYSNYAACHHDVEAPIDGDNFGVFFLNSKLTREDLKDGAAYTLFLGEKFPDDAELGWISGTPSTLRNTGSPLNEVTRAASRGIASPPWLFDYPAPEGRWSWDNRQVDPITGEMVTVEGATAPAVESTTSPQAGTPPSNAAPGSDAPQAKETQESSTPAPADPPATEAPSVGSKIDPKLVPDKDGVLPHSKLGGNGVKPLVVGGFASSHMGGVNFAFGDGSVRFVADDVAASVMGRLANREDGNLLDARELP